MISRGLLPLSPRVALAFFCLVALALSGCGGADGSEFGSTRFDPDQSPNPDPFFDPEPEPEPFPDAGMDPLPDPMMDPDPDSDPDADKDPGSGETHWIVVDVANRYFEQESAVDATSGYVFEDARSRRFTQPTAIGFYIQWLTAIATKEMSDDKLNEVVTAEEALLRLKLIFQAILSHQEDPSVAFRGLLPWLALEEGQWRPVVGEDGQAVMLGDNVNLSLSLASASGAMRAALGGQAGLQPLIADIEAILEAQRPGYNFLLACEPREDDTRRCRFRRGWDMLGETFVGGDGAYHDIHGDEFRAGILFVLLRFGLPLSLVEELVIHLRQTNLPDEGAVYSLASWDGGAFQMLWPAMNFPEADEARNTLLLDRFVRASLEFSRENGLNGLVSACYGGVGRYVPEAGIDALAIQHEPPRNESLASLYSLGAAYYMAPSEAGKLLDTLFPDPDTALGGTGLPLITEHGLWEGFDEQGEVVEEQIAINVLSFVIGLMGTSANHTRRYLDDFDLSDPLDALYEPGARFGALPVDQAGLSPFFEEGTVVELEGDDIRITNPSFDDERGLGVSIALTPMSFSARTLDLSYLSDAPLGRLQVEFKRAADEPSLIVITPPLDSADAQSPGLISIDLPAAPGLKNIREVVLRFLDPTGEEVDVIFGGVGLR